MASKAFSDANRMWFREGRTARALAEYRRAAEAAPTDPVVAFQLARALWAVGRRDEARHWLERAADQQSRLSDLGRDMLEHWLDLTRRPAALLPSSDLPDDELDRDRLEASDQPFSWRTVAEVAASRGMHGLACHALDRWDGVPIDGEDARDIERIRADAHQQEALLDRMRRRFDPPQSRGASPSPGPRRSAPPPSAPPRPPVPPAPARPRAPRPNLPRLPFALAVEATPREAPVGTPTRLVATLINPTDGPLVANRRILVNHRGAPGEVWLEVDGPPGYRNSVGYRIRAGEADAAFFVPLAPGASLQAEWQLEEYQSLDLPGEYRVTLTYHLDRPHAPDGRPVPTGAVSATTRIRRTLPRQT